MRNEKIKIAIGKDWLCWHEKLGYFFEAFENQGIDVTHSFINLGGSDWLDIVDHFDVIVWNPNYMGLRLASHLKEKVYFIQQILGKLVFPNANSILPFESKVAESYIFSHFGIKTPKTVISFDHHDSSHQIEFAEFPVVLKKSDGAASQKVKLIQNKKEMSKILDITFCDELWGDSRLGTSKFEFICHSFYKRWFWYRLFSRFGLRQPSENVIYWQEFIPGNKSDLRITVIGDRYAYGFWRNNRPNDFRASGSGLIDYEHDVPKDLIRTCIAINKRLHFDSMCYDILFTKDAYVINEMSYNYVDTALFNAPGYYEIRKNEQLTYIEGHHWPQELWVKWILIRLGCLNQE